LYDYSFVSDAQMDNRHLVTRYLGRIPNKNHHGDLISTPPKKSAAQKFRPAGPIRAVPKESIAFYKFHQHTAKTDALKSPTAYLLRVSNTLTAGSPDQRL
jgi:hypothetical protein